MKLFVTQVLIYIIILIISNVKSKILHGHLLTSQNWAFLARFCFLSESGRFHYNFLVNGDPLDATNVKLLLYYDAPSQWPSVYPSNKTCQEKMSVLNPKNGQIIPLSALDYIAPVSGCERTGNPWIQVNCSSYREFKSSRPRWWFIALADCNAKNGLNVSYLITLTNGSPGSFWREHFSADEFWLLPLIIAAGAAYIFLLSYSIYVAIQLRLRRLLHITYKIFMCSMVCQFVGIVFEIYSLSYRGATGFDAPLSKLLGNLYESLAETSYTLLMILLALGYTITKSELRNKQILYIFWYIGLNVICQLALYIYQSEVFDPGLVLYIYESPPGFVLLALKVFAWGVFCICCYKTCRNTSTKSHFYASLLSLGSSWFLFHPLMVLIITFAIDKWVRESVVKGCSLWIIFTGHAMFLYVTRPASSNERFPFHIRTWQVVPVTVGQNHNYEPRRTATASVFTVQLRNFRTRPR